MHELCRETTHIILVLLCAVCIWHVTRSVEMRLVPQI